MISLNDFLNLDVDAEQFIYANKMIKGYLCLMSDKRSEALRERSFCLFINLISYENVNKETEVKVIITDVTTFNEITVYVGDKWEKSNSRYYVLAKTEIEETRKIAQKVCDILNKYPLHTAVID